MYAGMFRTAMDWLEDAGEFLKIPNNDFVNKAEISRADSKRIADTTSVEGGAQSDSEDKDMSSDDDSEESE